MWFGTPRTHTKGFLPTYKKKMQIKEYKFHVSKTLFSILLSVSPNSYFSNCQKIMISLPLFNFERNQKHLQFGVHPNVTLNSDHSEWIPFFSRFRDWRERIKLRNNSSVFCFSFFYDSDYREIGIGVRVGERVSVRVEVHDSPRFFDSRVSRREVERLRDVSGVHDGRGRESGLRCSSGAARGGGGHGGRRSSSCNWERQTNRFPIN